MVVFFLPLLLKHLLFFSFIVKTIVLLLLYFMQFVLKIFNAHHVSSSPCKNDKSPSNERRISSKKQCKPATHLGFACSDCKKMTRSASCKKYGAAMVIPISTKAVLIGYDSNFGKLSKI